LARFYLGEANRTYKCAKTISPRAVRCLQDYRFPGNVRELRNILENAVVMSNGDQIEEFIVESVLATSVGDARERQVSLAGGTEDLSGKLKVYEKELLVEAKKHCRTTREVARKLGISQPSVVRKFKQYKIG